MNFERVSAALVAALIMTLALFSGASADDRYQGKIVVDGTECSDKLNPNEPAILAIDTLVSVFEGHVTDTEQLIGIGLAGGDGCWVPIESVIPWTGGEDLNDQPIEGDNLGESYINTEGTDCMSEPSHDAAFVTDLYLGEPVVLIADGVQDGWQKVGLEANTCYVLAEYIGPPAEEQPETGPAPDEPAASEDATEPEVDQVSTETEITSDVIVAESVSITPEPEIVSAQSEIASIISLPSTGSGVDDGSPFGILAFIAVGVIAFLVWVGFMLYANRHKDVMSKVKRAHRSYAHWADKTED